MFQKYNVTTIYWQHTQYPQNLNLQVKFNDIRPCPSHPISHTSSISLHVLRGTLVNSMPSSAELCF